MKIFISLMSIIIFTISCDDLIVPDITDEVIEINSPPDNFRPNSTTVNFSWNTIDGADRYQIEVVRGRFDSVISFTLDTFIQGTQFSYNFNPASYQWSLVATNPEYSTAKQIRSFIIDSVSDLSQSTVLLNFPLRDSVYRDSALTFKWGSLFGAKSYQIQLFRQSDGALLINDTTNSDFYASTNILSTAIYNWQVKAINDQSETVYSISNFEVDQISPSKPALLSPNDDVVTTIGPRISFDWHSELDSKGFFDSIYIKKDTVNSTFFGFRVNSSDFNSDSLSAGTYLWKVVSYDKALNRSTFSDEWRFKVQ